MALKKPREAAEPPDTRGPGVTEDMTDAVARYLPEPVRVGIERAYYDRIREQAALESLARDPQFLADPAHHMGLYTDHSAIHARDVARQVLHVLDVAHGLLIPERGLARLEFMKGYAVLLAFTHDIGMVDFSAFGRDMHPEFAAQEVFRAAWDPRIEAIWQADPGGIASRLCALENEDAAQEARGPRAVLREALSLAMAHSKRKVPADLLNDRPALRACLREALTADLWELHQRQEGGAPAHAPRAQAAEGAHVLPDGAFGWLVDARPALRALADDVVDTVRALRCADALRQRGTVLRTSAGYQIMISRMTAEAVYTLRSAAGETFVVEAGTKVSAEANIASSELTPEGDMRLAFHRGSFPTEQVVRRAVQNAAAVVAEVEADIIESFRRPAPAAGGETGGEPRKCADEMRILLEATDDNLDFADMVRAEVERGNPALRGRVRVVPSLANISEHERALYLRGREPGWDHGRRAALLAAMARWGHRAEQMDPDLAFEHVRILRLAAGEVLIEANAPAGFVYVPLGPGLRGRSLGGYPGFPSRPYVPLGDTGVIRGSVRNATITATRDVEVIVIPKETYMKHWFRAYSLDALKDRLAALSGPPA